MAWETSEWPHHIPTSFLRSISYQNDALQWIIDEAVERKQNVEEIVRRLLFFNFAAIHTSSNVGNWKSVKYSQALTKF